MASSSISSCQNNEVRYLKSIDWTDEFLPEVTEDDKETVKNVQQNLGYFISYNNLFSTRPKKGADFSVSDVTDALDRPFDRLINPYHKRLFTTRFSIRWKPGSRRLATSAAP